MRGESSGDLSGRDLRVPARAMIPNSVWALTSPPFLDDLRERLQSSSDRVDPCVSRSFPRNQHYTHQVGSLSSGSPFPTVEKGIDHQGFHCRVLFTVQNRLRLPPQLGEYNRAAIAKIMPGHYLNNASGNFSSPNRRRLNGVSKVCRLTTDQAQVNQGDS